MIIKSPNNETCHHVDNGMDNKAYDGNKHANGGEYSKFVRLFWLNAFVFT